MTEEGFVLATAPWAKSERFRPVCECSNPVCLKQLPQDAAAYIAPGQFVVHPDHRDMSRRFVAFDGFVVEEA